MIPKVIHFVWIGPEMPDWAKDNIRLFHELNPDFICKVHGEWSLIPTLRPAYNNVKGEHVFSRRSDILRISVLLQHGGWYFDTDFLPIRSLSEVYRDQGNFPRECFVTHGDWVAERHCIGNTPDKTRKWIANGVIGTAPDSPFLACVLRGILLAEAQGRRGWGEFGPILFTEIAERYPGIVHIDSMDNWYRLQPREKSIAAYKRIREAGYKRETIIKEVGEPLPYAFHMSMMDEVIL